MALHQKINGDREKVAKFSWPLFASEEFGPDELPDYFLDYDYDSIEGINNLITELGLENKKDENSNIFLTRLRCRQDHLKYHSEEAKIAREARRKQTENTKFFNLVSLADLLEDIEKEIIRLENYIDKYIELQRYCMQDIHGDTEEQTINSALFRIISWHKKRTHKFLYKRSWETESEACFCISCTTGEEDVMTIDEINKMPCFFRSLYKGLTDKNKVLIREWENAINQIVKTFFEGSLDIDVTNLKNDQEFNFIKRARETQIIIEKAEEAIKKHEERLEAAGIKVLQYYRNRKVPRTGDMEWRKIKKRYHRFSLDTEEETSRKCKEWLRRKTRDISSLEKIFDTARIKWLEKVAKQKSEFLKKNSYKLSLILAKAAAKTAKRIQKQKESQETWNSYQDHILEEQQNEEQYYQEQEKEKNNKIEPKVEDEGYYSGDEKETPNTTKEVPTEKSTVRPEKLSIEKAPSSPTPTDVVKTQTQIKNRIDQLLKNLKIKTADLPAELQKWEIKLFQMKSITEIENFAKKVEQFLAQKSFNNSELKPKNKLNLWLPRGTGLMIIIVGIGTIFFLWRKKTSKK